MKAVDNTVRRSWDKEEYEKKAKDRAEREKDEVSIGKTTRVSRGRPAPRELNAWLTLFSFFIPTLPAGGSAAHGSAEEVPGLGPSAPGSDHRTVVAEARGG